MNSRFRWVYVLAFVGAICGVVFLSLPNEETMIGMSRDDGNLQNVERLLRQRFDREPTDAETALRLIEAALANGNAPLAETTARAALRHNPDDVRLRRCLAECELARGDIEAAFAVLPEKDRDRSFCLSAMKQARVRGDLHLAETMLLTAEKDRLDKPDVWLTLAGWRADRYDLKGEAKALERALESDPQHRAAWDRYFSNRVWSLDAEGVMRAAARLEAFAPLDRGKLELLYSFQIARGDVAGSAATMEKLATAPDARPADRIGFATILYSQNNAARANDILLTLLSSPEENMERWERVNAMNVLRTSALATKDLDLALALVALPAEPNVKRENRTAALDLALASGQVEKAEEFLRAELAQPDATADVVLAGLDLAYHRERFADMLPLLERLERAPNPAGTEIGVDAFVYAALENEKSVDEWRAETQRRSDAAAVWVGLARAALRAGNVADVALGVDAAFPLLNAGDIPDIFALMEAATFLINSLPAGSLDREARVRQAALLADMGMNGPLAKSRWFLPMAADAYERDRRMDEAGETRHRIAALYPDDTWNRIGLARMAADRTDEAAAEAQLAALAAEKDGVGADGIRAQAYVCLGMADALNRAGGERAARAAAWVKRGETIFLDNAALLPLDDVENAMLAADIAERKSDWPRARDAWEAVAAKTPESIPAWLGLARSTAGGGDAEAAWQALDRAERLGVGDPDLRLQMAWQYLAAAEALPESDASRPERMAHAGRFAENLLQTLWDANLASTLFFRALAEDRMDKADALLARMGNAPPDVHAAMAEALAAKMPDTAAGEARERLRGRIMAEADAALRSDDAAILLRMTAILQTVDEKERLQTVLARIETVPAPEGEAGWERLRQLSEAYGFLGDRERQFALIEERARLSGGLTEWLDAVDRHTWAGDYTGALALLDEVDAAYPDAVEALNRRLALFADDNRPGPVIAAFEKARGRDATVEERLSADALAALGTAYDDVRATPNARRFLRLSLDKEPANKRGSMGAARLLRRDGNLGGAIRQLRLYVEASADDPWGWLELANTRTQVNQNGRPEYLKVMALTEPDAAGNIPEDVRAARAVALRQLGREKEARELLAGTVGPVITNPDVACDYAQMLMDIGKYEEAVDILRRTVVAFPNHVWAYRLEATILVRWRKYDLAAARLKEALAWSPSDGEVRRDLGFATQLWERTWDSQKGWLSAGGR